MIGAVLECLQERPDHRALAHTLAQVLHADVDQLLRALVLAALRHERGHAVEVEHRREHVEVLRPLVERLAEPVGIAGRGT